MPTPTSPKAFSTIPEIFSEVHKAYRFGFNGKERDNEGMGGGGSTYDYGFRIYNGQIGKFLSVDPLTKSYPWYTPYQFAGNKPIWAIDLDGLEESVYTDRFKRNMGQAFVVIENSERLKELNNSVNRKDKYAEIKVFYTYGNYGEGYEGFVVPNLKGAARWVQIHRHMGTKGLSTEELTLFEMYDKLFTDHKIDIQKDILNDERDVMLVNMSPISANPISSFAHELRAHLKNAVEGKSRDTKTEHEVYYNLKKYPKLKEFIKGESSPPWSVVGEDSDAGRDYKAVQETIDKLTSKEEIKEEKGKD